MGILCLRRLYRHCKVVLTGVTTVVILQTGFGFLFCMGNVSLSIAALCHAKNLPELETWFRNIIILEWEGGKLDKYVGILRFVRNTLILILVVS